MDKVTPEEGFETWLNNIFEASIHDLNRLSDEERKNFGNWVRANPVTEIQNNSNRVVAGIHRYGMFAQKAKPATEEKLESKAAAEEKQEPKATAEEKQEPKATPKI